MVNEDIYDEIDSLPISDKEKSTMKKMLMFEEDNSRLTKQARRFSDDYKAMIKKFITEK